MCAPITLSLQGKAAVPRNPEAKAPPTHEDTPLKAANAHCAPSESHEVDDLRMITRLAVTLVRSGDLIGLLRATALSVAPAAAASAPAEDHVEAAAGSAAFANSGRELKQLELDGRSTVGTPSLANATIGSPTVKDATHQQQQQQQQPTSRASALRRSTASLDRLHSDAALARPPGRHEHSAVDSRPATR